MTETYLEEWIRKAEEDYTVVTVLAHNRLRPTPNAICFHSQQCAEKYLKAFLVRHNRTVPRVHDLLELYRHCLAINPAFAFIVDLLDILNPFAVEFRYPGEEATLEEAKGAVHAVEQVRRFVRQALGLAEGTSGLSP